MSPNVDVEQGTNPVKGQAPTTTSEVVIINASNANTAEGCQCTPGWILFGVGWAVPLCWLVGVFLPFCTKNRNDKRAAIGSGVMICVYGLVLGLVLGLYVVPMIAITQAFGTANLNSLAAQLAAVGSQLSTAAGQMAAGSPPLSAAGAAQIAAASAAVGVTTNLTCYQSTGGDKVQAIKIDNKNGKPLLCIKYSFTCTPQQVFCTADQIAQKAVIWNYIPAAESTCTSIASVPSMYSNVVCCSTDLCNAVDPVADPTTVVLQGPVMTLPWM